MHFHLKNCYLKSDLMLTLKLSFLNKLNYRDFALLPMWMGNTGLRRYTYCASTVSATIKYRYESLMAGNPELVVEYKGRLFCFSTEANQEKFMR